MRAEQADGGVQLLSATQPDCGLATGFYRVARYGIVAYGLTANATYSGMVSFPIEIGLPNKPDVRSLTAYAGSAPLPWAEAAQQDSGYWQLDWNTSLVPNGTYAIKLVAVFADETAVTNSVVNVTVSNALTFPAPYAAAFGSQLWVRAQFNQSNVTWEMDLFGEAGDYIGTFGDFSADGNVSFVWDLFDADQNFRADQAFTGVFYNVTAVPGPLQPAPAPAGQFAWYLENSFLPVTHVAVAWADLAPNGLGSQINAKQHLFVANGTVDIVGSAYTLSPGNAPLSETAFRIDGAAAKTNLLGYLADSPYRAFYFFGHGLPDSIGGQVPGSVITSDEVRKTLGVQQRTNSYYAPHPYRFVFLDGCTAANGSFPVAFGIPRTPLTRNHFLAMGVAAKGFVGFTEESTFNPNQYAQKANMMANFWNQFMIQHLPLQQCIDNAKNNAVSPLPLSAVVFGATDLRWDLQ